MKQTLIMIVALACSLAASAQHEEGEFGASFRAGASISNITNDNEGVWRTGFAIYIEGDYALTDNMAVSAGLGFVQQGEKAKGAAIHMNLDYINVPILFQFYPVKGLALKTGVQPGFMVRKSISGYGNTFDSEGFLNQLKTFDLSIPFGVSYEISGFIVDFRYNLGVTKLYDITYTDGTREQGRNSVFTISLGYRV